MIVEKNETFGWIVYKNINNMYLENRVNIHSMHADFRVFVVIHNTKWIIFRTQNESHLNFNLNPELSTETQQKAKVHLLLRQNKFPLFFPLRCLAIKMVCQISRIE